MMSLPSRSFLRFTLPLFLVAFAAMGCGDDDGDSRGEGNRRISVPLDNEFGPLTLVQALEMALPGDSILVQAGYTETLTATLTIQSSQTPLYVGGAKTRPLVVAPAAGGPGLRFLDPKPGTRVESMKFRGGNAALQVEGGSFAVHRCEFEAGAVHVLGSSPQALTVTECVMDRPGLFGIEMDGGTVTATQNTIWRAGDCGLYIAGGARLVADKNIISESNNWGIACREEGVIVAEGSLCNDVFGSGNAPYSLCSAPETDFALDPMLCDPGAGDFRVDVRSPCAPQNVAGSECAVSGNPELGVGALGVGCTPSDE